MKFASYLEETQIPEWKRAYLDYKLLKGKLSAVKRQYEDNPPTKRMSAAVSILRNGLVNTTPPHAFRNTTPKNALYAEEYASLTASGPTPTPSQPGSPAGGGRSTHSLAAASQDTLHDLELPPAMQSLEPLAEDKSPNVRVGEQGAKGADLGRRKTLPGRALAGHVEVDAFYKKREKDAILRANALREQIEELRGHKELLDEYRDGLWPGVLSVFGSVNTPRHSKATGSAENLDESRPPSREKAHVGRAAHDPDAYRRAKKKLKKAVLEFYRGIEHLQNYRILNVTGFRKALKKFDKITKMSIQEQYMRERVEGRDFTSGSTCAGLLKEVEQIYATQFAQGDEKKARGRLRASPRKTTHHYGTFRSGIWIGLSIPALAMALYRLLQKEAREEVPEWQSLLQVYAALSIPVMFVLLVGLNLVAWAQARINFVFIFGLDVRTVIDARQYVELPSFLFATLAYAFCISFSLTGSEVIPPTKWPIIWVGLALVTIFNPLPIFHRSARYWFLRTFGMLFLSGTRRVEFADFWLGDQFCSMVYTMSNMYFLVCAYVDQWHRIEERCQLEQHWTIPLILSTIPFFIRFIQSIRRYFDSKQTHHLTNAAKYVASIVYYVTYYVWRHNDMDYDIHFGLFVTFATINSIFVRLENEHIGNADQFRVTREIPLPYAPGKVESDDEERSPRPRPRQLRRSKDQNVIEDSEK
ncbi:hypothetical protein RSAG8_01531, partial [Rhizoctonia solani AG-8 WAC10335]